MQSFTASDLSRKRKDVLAASKREGALIRDTGGMVLALIPFERLAAAERLNALGLTLTALVASLPIDDPPAGSLGEASWAATWSRSRRRQLVDDFGEALALATSIKDPRPAEALLDALRPRPGLGGQFDAAATWARISDADRAFLKGERRERRTDTTTS